MASGQFCVNGIGFVVATGMINSAFSRLVSGAVGAGVLTAIHQTAQKYRDDAPRMDVVGMDMMSRTIAEAGGAPPSRAQLFNMTLAGEMLANSLYYSGIPAETSRKTWTRAVGMGLTAGFGALTLPRYVVGVDAPHSSSLANNAMTVAWYLAGALAAAACAETLRRR